MGMTGNLLHFRLRVSDLEESIEWFKSVLGFEVTSKSISPDGNQLAFMELEGEPTKLELAHSADFGEIDLQEDLFHVAFALKDWEAFAARIEDLGIEFSWGPVEGSSGRRIAFVDHPDGYEIEIIEVED